MKGHAVINDLEKAREILLDLENAIEKAGQICLGIRVLNPDFEQASEKEWKKKASSYWLHGATKLEECNILEQWLYTSVSLSQTAKSDAIEHYDEWDDFTAEGDEDNIYADFSTEDLLQPEDSEKLYEYIWRLAKQVETKGWGNKKNKRALRSFLWRLRELYPLEEIAFIEHVFPEKMDLHYNRLRRLIKPQVYPIPLEIAAEIIKTLAHEVIRGRGNARLKNAEALALCWLCLTSSRLRLPISLERIHSIDIRSMMIENEVPYLDMPTIFGPQKIQISKRFSEYLQSINDLTSNSPRNSIISSDLRDLRRSLKSAIKKAKISSEYGNITFLTFMSHPHYWGENIRPGKIMSKSKTAP